MDIESLSEAYLRNYRLGTEEDFWAFEDVVEMCNEYQGGVDVSLALIQKAENDMELAYVAAGPVEDTVKWHGLKAWQQFERAAKNSEKVERALTGVWLSQEHEAYPAWVCFIQNHSSL